MTGAERLLINGWLVPVGQYNADSAVRISLILALVLSLIEIPLLFF